MMSMQKKLKTLARILKENTSAERIYHYYHPADEEAPFIVWQEDGEQESFHANNKKEEQCVHGTIDCYTLEEFDTLLDEVQDALRDAEIGWSLLSVQYEDTTNFIHYEWEFYL